MTLLRTVVVQKINAGISNVMKALVSLFFDQGAHDMSKAGVQVQLPSGESLRIFLSLDIIIADEAALHGIYVCKGSGGLKPCMLCANVFNQKNERGVLQHDPTGMSQDHCCSDSSQLILHTSSTIKANSELESRVDNSTQRCIRRITS